jgi:UDP-N-acetylmuramate dehydrogenase
MKDIPPLRNFIEKFNAETRFSEAAFAEKRRHPCQLHCALSIRYDEPMAAHTTFKVGGPADVWVQGRGEAFPEYAAALLKAARSEGIPIFILGGGANTVVSDKGIRGIVLDLKGWQGVTPGTIAPIQSFLSANDPKGHITVTVRSGTVIDTLVDELAGLDRSGFEFLAGMPGTVGGAVWMNARCYEKSISDVLVETEILDENEEIKRIPFNPADFDYKQSPFQKRDVLILSAAFHLEKRPAGEIQKEMAAHRRDREEKGHYRFPSAGSVFKNNRAFGKPTGKIIDELGLRGLQLGGAQVAPFHGNFIINTGNAAATDIRTLTDMVREKVRDARGIELESEILFVGDWS